MKNMSKMSVFINGEEVSLFRGMRVKHALVARDQELYEAAVEGRIVIHDENGHVVGLEGALQEDTRLMTDHPG